MVKYLHKYSSEGDFNEDYNDELTSVVESFVCSAGTFNYLGKGIWFTAPFWKNGSVELITEGRGVAVGDYAISPLNTSERYEITAVSSDGGVVTAFTCSEGTFIYDREDFFCLDARPNYYSWGNGQRQVLITQFRDAAVGDGDGLSTGAHDLNNNTSVEITQVNTVSRDPAYREPWVSLTVEGNRRRVDYNKRIWMDLSSYAYPVYGSPVNLGTVSEPKPSNRGKVYVKEPDGQTYQYNYEKEVDGAVRLWRHYPDGSGYAIEISPDGTAQWYYHERKS